jgi:hypothetical protein
MPAEWAGTRRMHAILAPGDSTMRALFLIAVAAILMAGFGLTLFSFARPITQQIADSGKRTSGDVSQTRGTAELPMQKIHDMSVVFSHDD